MLHGLGEIHISHLPIIYSLHGHYGLIHFIFWLVNLGGNNLVSRSTSLRILLVLLLVEEDWHWAMIGINLLFTYG